MIAAINYLDRLARATEIEQVWQMFCAEMVRFGFDRLLYGYNHFGTEHSVGSWEDALILSNNDPGYLKKFIEEEYYKHAPLAEWALKNTGARPWAGKGDPSLELNETQARVVALNTSYGLVAGYSVSFATPTPRARGIVSMGARPGLTQQDVNALWERDGVLISVIANMTHLKIISLPHTNERAKLSRRQQEVLNWVADGKTYQDIATIMGVTMGTVEKHLRLVRQKLNVETTPQAVLKASFWNQMFVVKM
ncbi:MAG TPA: LuxR family transcriptional regulator [Aliiroseovarius sp.]|nr:LuxR family transcriptional regulator [Aliiroseovarius sp.]